MKRFLSLLAFLIVSCTFVAAQPSNGNGNTTNTSGNYNPWATSNWPPAVINWLQYGGPMPMYIVGKVIGAASTWGWQNFGLTPNGMLQMYYAGKLTIVLISTSPPTVLTFKVSYSGGIVIIHLEDLG